MIDRHGSSSVWKALGLCGALHIPEREQRISHTSTTSQSLTDVSKRLKWVVALFCCKCLHPAELI